ncbi:unnamed protein product [Leptosia nina]|uniref:Tyr recombinase domain-containing protein n=1 Tax=Leptosia nina TaxID=320188 RepID=A0AAV1IYK3_9NEOP
MGGIDKIDKIVGSQPKTRGKSPAHGNPPMPSTSQEKPFRVKQIFGRLFEVLSQKLEEITSSFFNSENYYFRSNTFQSTTTLANTYAGYSKKVRDSCVSGHESRNSNNDSRACIGICAHDAIFHIPAFYNKKKQRQESCDFQSEGIKSVYETRALSSVSSLSNAEVLTTGRLDGKIGYQPGLLPRPNLGETPMFPTCQLQGKTTSNDVPTIWLSNRSKNVCFGNKLDSRTFTPSRFKSHCLLGRLPARPPGQGSPPGPGSQSHAISAESRLEHKLKEIDMHSYETNRFSGYHLGHKLKQKVPTHRKNQQNTSVSIDSSVSRQLDSQAGPMPLRVSQFCNLHHPPGKVALPNATATQQCFNEESNSAQPIGRRSETRIGLVATQHRSKDRDPLAQKSHKLPNNRRFRCSVGSPSQQQICQRSLDSAANDLALQSEGDACCNSCNLIGSRSLEGFKNNSTERQQNSCIVYKKRRRNEVEKTACNDQRTFGTDGQFEYSTNPSSLTGNVQHGSRSSLAKSQRRRMASFTRGKQGNIQSVGNTRNRSFCFKRGTRRGELCYARLIRLERLLSRRLQQILEIRPGVDISSAGASTSSIAPPQLSARQVHCSSTQVDEAFLAPRSKKSSFGSSSYDTRSRQNSNQHRDTTGSASSAEITNGSMVNFGWDSLIENWSNDEKNLLSTCWRQSTRKTYAPIWKKWVKWCQENNLDYQFPAPTSVARYLARLFLNDHLAYRSILVHKSVIASICETLSDVKISSNNLVKHLLKAISIAKIIPQKLPIWDARTVIHYLRDSSPNENSLFDVSKRTATLLLLTSGRRVHDLTLLHCDPQHFIDKGDSIILHPVFGSKTDTGSYRQSSWTLLDCPDKRLNPLFWLRTLVEVSKFTRGSLTNLFITTRDPVKPATTTIIGGWVKKVLSESGIEASPGSCRSAVASLNFLEKYPINEILAKANWRHEQTFKRYYCRNVESNTQRVETHSLSQYFKPSDD